VLEEDVRNGTLGALKAKSPWCLQPPYLWLCHEDRFDIKVTHTAPYTSPLCCIEWKWMDGKGWVANARNQKIGRSLAEVVMLLREKWYCPVEDPEVVEGPTPGLRQPIDYKKFVDHCHNLMEEKIEDCVANNGPLSGTIFDLKIDNSHFDGCTTDKEMDAAFRIKAGMDKSITCHENDTEFDGYEHAINNNDEVYDDPEEAREEKDSDDEANDSDNE
jgi:hypothetical protein